MQFYFSHDLRRLISALYLTRKNPQVTMGVKYLLSKRFKRKKTDFFGEFFRFLLGAGVPPITGINNYLD